MKGAVTYPKLHFGREVGQLLSDILGHCLTTVLVRIKVHIAGDYNAFCAANRLDYRFCKRGTSVRHAEGGRPRAILGFYNLVATELDALREGLQIGSCEASWEGWLGLRQQGDDLKKTVTACISLLNMEEPSYCNTTVASDNRNGHFGRKGASKISITFEY